MINAILEGIGIGLGAGGSLIVLAFIAMVALGVISWISKW